MTGSSKRPLAKAPAALLVGLTAALGLVPACVTSDAASVSDAAAPPVESAPPSKSGADKNPSAPLAAEVAEVLGVSPSEVTLTIDARLQAIVEEEAATMRKDWSPDSSTVIVMDPASGEIRAMVGADTAQRPIEPGSTFKLVATAGALDEAGLTPSTKLDCGPGFAVINGRRFADNGSNGELALDQAIAVSSNVAALRVLEQLTPERYNAWLERSRTLKPSSLELRGAAPGVISPNLYAGRTDWEHVSLGHKVQIAPAQLLSFYAAIANGGTYRDATLVRRTSKTEPSRIFSEKTAADMRSMLELAVTAEKATGKAAQVRGVRVAGKTGTAQLTTNRVYASFVGFAPADAPKYVILVGALESKEDAVGGRVAAPTFARIVARALSTK